MKKDIEILKLKSELSINRIKKYIFVVLFLAEIVILALFIAKYAGFEFDFLHPQGKKIAVVRIDEAITDELAQNICDRIDEIKDDKSYKGLIVKLSSPGGSPSASQEIAEYLKDLNKSLPVTMYIDSMAASGAYYIASAIKPIISNKNAIVGSIGVIMPHYDASELAKRLGVKEESLTAGKYKQPFSLLKKMTKESKEYMKSHLLYPAYENFIDDVATNRGISKEIIKKYAEGQVYVANKKEIRNILVDRISNYFKIKEEFRKQYGKNLAFVDIYQKDKIPSFLKSFVDYFFEKVEFGLR
jgi:protease-4